MAPITRKKGKATPKDDLVSLEVTGPTALLRDPVLRRVKKCSKIRDVVGKFLCRSRFEGYKATKIKGSLREAIELDRTVQEFVGTFKRPPSVIKLKLMRPKGVAAAEPVIITLEEDEEDMNGGDEEEEPMALGGSAENFFAGLEGIKGDDDVEMEEDGPEDVNSVAGAGEGSFVAPPPPPPDNQAPGSSREMLEEIARERGGAEVPVPPVVVGARKKVPVKMEAGLNLKHERSDAVSTIAELKTQGVKIDDLKKVTKARMARFSNALLLMVREEVRELHRSSGACSEWEKVVCKVPKCAYLLMELFKDASIQP